MPRSDFQKVGNYADATEAEHVCSILGEHDMAAFVDGAHANSWMPHVGTALSGVSVYVINADAESALEIIESLELGIDKHAAPWFCGPCQVEVEGGFEVCWSCGKPRHEVEANCPGSASLVDPTRSAVGNISSDNGSNASNPYCPPKTDLAGERLVARTQIDDEDLELNNEAEKMLLDAFRASIIGLVCLPMVAHVYSMYLLIRASLLDARFSDRGRSRFAWAIGINVVSVCVWGYFFTR
jgi:hypothetical protein